MAISKKRPSTIPIAVAIVLVAVLIVGAALAGNGNTKTTENGSSDKDSGNTDIADAGNTTDTTNTNDTTNSNNTSYTPPDNNSTNTSGTQNQTAGEVIVRIIEVESNPPGTDAGNEWIIIKNQGSVPVDLTRWTVRSSNGETNEYGLSGTIDPGQSIKITFPTQFLDNNNEVVSLVDSKGNEVDVTPAIDDTSNSSWTWVRPGA